MGLGIVGLLQAVVWIGSSFLLVRWSGSTFGLSAGLQFPPAIVGWGIIFFMLGYGLYAGFMAGIGALVPNLKEAASAAFAVSSPLLLGLMLMGVTIDDPDGAIALGFSLFSPHRPGLHDDPHGGRCFCPTLADITGYRPATPEHHRHYSTHHPPLSGPIAPFRATLHPEAICGCADWTGLSGQGHSPTARRPS